jgi:hypothetical protein
MVNRQTALRSLAVGDIFHGRSPSGASLVCLVTSVTESTIRARRITTQDDLEFDRQTGIELGEVTGRIDCVARFPRDIHDVFLELDRKYQGFREMDRNGIEPDPEQLKLTAPEKRALLFIDEHVSSNPI